MAGFCRCPVTFRDGCPGKLPAFRPGEGGAAFFRHVPYGIIGHGNTVPGQQLVLPGAVIGAGDGLHRGIRQGGSGGVGVFTDAGHVAAQVVAISKGLPLHLVIHTDQLVPPL